MLNKHKTILQIVSKKSLSIKHKTCLNVYSVWLTLFLLGYIHFNL
jgi:hypothetical protein